MRIILLTSIAAALTLMSCSKEGDLPKDKLLEQLKKERTAIDEKISVLERDLGKVAGKNEGIPVSTITASQRDFEHVIDVKGSVDSRSSVMVTAKMAGTIAKLTVSNGQMVKKGQLLVELDAEITKRGIDEVKTQLDFATTLYEKQQRIYDQKAGSEVQFLSAKNQKESLERRLSSLMEQLELSRIYAPTSGYIDNLVPKLGENIAPGMPILTVVNTSDMRVIADLAESYINSVNVGDRATIIFGESGDTLNATVGIVSKNVNVVNRTIRVEIPIRSTLASIRPNMTCNVLINDVTIPKAITLPLTAVLREGDATYCYTVNDKGHVVRRAIKVGLISGSLIEVVSGLQIGENVIVKGMLDVAAGQHVRVIQ
jgi:membrane fusion protein (multidrug efflux system)